MKQLVYISRAKRDLSRSEIDQLLEEARELNVRASITGLLLYDGVCFIQALEGPRDAVRATMDRILIDRRHRSCAIYTRKLISSRQFGNWSMNARVLLTPVDAAYFMDEVMYLTAEVSDAAVRAAFIGFVGMARRSFIAPGRRHVL